MGRSYQILLPLLSLFFVRVDLTDLFPMTYDVRLIKLMDADTAEVKLGRRTFKVRIGKIDAPEKGQPFLNRGGDAGKAALKCAQAVVKNKRMFVVKVEKHDVYGRLLGDLDHLSFDLIKSGCATLYPYATFSSRSEKWTYIRALSEAKRNNAGLWSKGGFRQPKLWRKERFSKRTVRRQSHQRDRSRRPYRPDQKS